MFGMGQRAQEKGEKLEEREISSLVSDGKPVEYVVGEELSLMGSKSFTFANGKEIVIFKPGDEIMVLTEGQIGMNLFDPSESPEMPDLIDGNQRQGKIEISIWNKDNPHIAQTYYFIASEVANRKIKIKKGAPLVYNKR